MKALKHTSKIVLMILLMIGSAFTAKAVARPGVAQPGINVPIESFYDELAPYGQWTQHPNYGNVWLPSAGPDFQPYATNGHWVVTEYGNTWVSDYDWGWAPFHYGRWVMDPAYGGWIWIPGSDWGPAWVTWRSGGGYYGWAPLGPGMNINVNINIPAPYWTFVPQIYITSPRIYNYCVPRPQVVNIYHNTTIINNVYQYNNRSYFYGPQRVEIERVTRRSVPVYRVDYRDRPGRTVVSNGTVGFYRPNPSSNYGRGYGNGRPDRFDNNRGNNGYNAPEPRYGSTYPNDRPSRGSYEARPEPGQNSYPVPNRNDRFESNRPDRFGPSRGSYAPNTNPAPADNSVQPNRSYERFNRPSSPGITLPQGQGRPEGGFQRTPESRESRGQVFQQRTQGAGPRFNNDRGQVSPGERPERPSRGPR
ncbi:DUF6600 domain-containing protein [Spirosoma soli]|uniref:DUF6600 domain-containing protein n=1 Tax=Spirosoma soli TaxID=1770529 RepID=A0ABW5M8X9_9BACT